MCKNGTLALLYAPQDQVNPNPSKDIYLGKSWWMFTTWFEVSTTRSMQTKHCAPIFTFTGRKNMHWNGLGMMNFKEKIDIKTQVVATRDGDPDPLCTDTNYQLWERKARWGGGVHAEEKEPIWYSGTVMATHRSGRTHCMAGKAG